MSVEPENTPEEELNEDAFEAYEEASEEANEGEESETALLQTRIAELEQENADIKDRAMRAMADAENTKKRAERSAEDTAKFAISKFAKDLLEVADNMRRAIDSIPAEEAENNALVKNIQIGIEATERSMLSTFEKNGLQKIEPTEGKFDPNFHEAMFEAEDPSKEAGDILQLIEPGYSLNDRLLRPARVGVVKNGPAQKVDEQA